MKKVVIYNTTKGPIQYEGYSVYCSAIVFSNKTYRLEHDRQFWMTKNLMSFKGLSDTFKFLAERKNINVEKFICYTDNQLICSIFDNLSEIAQKVTSIEDKYIQKYINIILLSMQKLYEKYKCSFTFHYKKFDYDTDKDNKYILKCIEQCNINLKYLSDHYKEDKQKRYNSVVKRYITDKQNAAFKDFKNKKITKQEFVRIKQDLYYELENIKSRFHLYD